MSDYIKRGDALKAVNGIHEDDLPRNNKIEVCDVLTLVVPSADVAPVRHGKWIDITDSHIGTCSLCGDRWSSVDMMNYCPNCGARMDGEK